MLAKPVPIGTLAQLNDVTVTTPAADESLAYNGTKWVNKNMGAVSAGAGVSYYLDATVSAGANETLKRIPSGAAEAIDTGIANNNTVFISRYVSDTVLGGTQIDAGTWDFNTYAKVDSAAGVTSIVQRINKRVVKTGTIAITGSGLSRTATVSGATPFVSGDANADITLATLIETPNGTFWITAFTSSSVVTVQMTNAGYTNESGVAYSMYYYLFKASTPTITNTTVALITTKTVQTAFTGITATDKLVAAYFVTTTANQNITASLYYNGTSHYSHIETPLVTRHNDLAGLQGGTTSEYYHLTSAQNTAVGSLGTMSTQAASAVAITGGTISGVTTIAAVTSISTPSIITASSGNLTITPSGNADIILQGSGSGKVGIGVTPDEKLHINGALRVSSNAIGFTASAGVLIDYYPAGGVARFVNSNGSTAGLFTLDNAGRISIASGIVGTSMLTLPAGTATANTAPLQFTSGPVETTPRAGCVEYDGTDFYATNSTLLNKPLNQQYILASKLGADMNVTTDQAITMPSGKWVVRKIVVANASISLTTAAGGLYSAASKGGTAIVASTQVYSTLTTATKFLDLTLTATMATDYLTNTTTYFSLTTAQGAAATADIFIIGDRLDH